MELRHIRPNTLDSLVASKMKEDVYHAREYIRDGGWVLDVGANIGAFCLHVKSFCRQARIVCVEPMPSNLDTLRANVTDQAFIEPVALVGKSGPVVMYDFGPMYSGCHSIYPLGVAQAVPVEVHGKTLADLFEEYEIDEVQFLKLDCQGAEYDVIPSADASLLQRINYIALEVHHTIAGGEAVLGTIPEQAEKARRMYEYLGRTHRLIHGNLVGVDTEQVWENKRLSTSNLDDVSAKVL